MSQVQLMKNQDRDWRLLEFVAPISEKVENDVGEFLITGVAINETTTLNNVKYVSEELQKATESFRDVPILLDHKNEVKNIVGRTTENVMFNNSLSRIEYEAKIMDNDIKEMIKDGRIKNVSIGAKVNDLVEESDGSMKAIGIHGLEISIVAVPGDGMASLGQAIKDNFHLKEMSMATDTDCPDKQLNKNGVKMTEDIKVETPEVPKEAEVVEEPKEEVKEEKVKELAKIDGKIAKATLDLRKKELAILEKKISESEEPEEPKVEEPKEEVKDETKGEVEDVAEEKVDASKGIIVERAKTGYSMYRDYATEGADTKLKRLVR